MKSFKNYLAYLGLVLGIFNIAAVVEADTFDLIGGGSFSGQIVGDSKGAVIRIRTNDGVEIELPKTKLSKTTRLTGENEKRYVKSIALKDDSLAAHREAVAECFAGNQKQLGEAHQERIVELDPTDKSTWADLDGRYVRIDRMQKSRGLVKKFEGRGWTTPEARAIAEVEQKRKEAIVLITKTLEKSIRNLNQSGPRGIEAANYLNTLADPLAVEPVFKLLQQEIDKGGNTQMFMDILARLPGTSASDKFIDLALHCQNVAIVDQCLELLMRSPYSKELAIQAFLGALGPKDVAMRNRAGSNLIGMVDERCIYALINTLVTKITKSKTTPGTNTFSPSGGVSSSTAQTVTFDEYHNHDSILQALSTVTGENFGFDQNRWRIWYAGHFADTNMDLRRDW
jgi:hypothetical protein